MEKKEKFEYITYNGKDLLGKDKAMFYKMRDVIRSQADVDMNEGEAILLFLDETSNILCMMDKDDLLGFSWITLAEDEKKAELSWMYADRDKMKGLDAKKLFDKSIEFCQNRGVDTLKFNCGSSWSRIKDVDRLVEAYGYTNSKDKEWYDASIDILEK